MDNKKTKYLTIIGIIVLCVALVSSTFAYFSAQAGGTTTRDVSVTSNTTDNLSFQISNDISFTASTANFYQGGNNVSGEATATATLTPNNKTNQATMNYYMYLNLTSNPITYSSTNTNEDPELILQVFDGNDQLVTLSNLGSQVSLGNGYGYDITGQSGLITLLDNHTITANNATEVETWRVVITLVNLGVDQNDNGGKTVTGEVIIQKESVSNEPVLTYYYWNSNFDDYGSLNEYQIPFGENLYGAYNSMDDLLSAIDLYATYDVEEAPFFIRSGVIDSNTTRHEVCYYDLENTDNYFCFGSDLWVETGDGINHNHYSEANSIASMTRLKNLIESELGITLYDNYEESIAATGEELYCYTSHGDTAGCYLPYETTCSIQNTGLFSCETNSLKCSIDDIPFCLYW